MKKRKINSWFKPTKLMFSCFLQIISFVHRKIYDLRKNYNCKVYELSIICVKFLFVLQLRIWIGMMLTYHSKTGLGRENTQIIEFQKSTGVKISTKGLWV